MPVLKINEDNKCWTLLQRCLCWKKKSVRKKNYCHKWKISNIYM